MLRTRLKDYNVILASGSPRRQNFFKLLDLDFSIDVREVEEVYPDTLQGREITDYLAQLKASVFQDLDDKEILVTSDTIVWKDDVAIGKPKDREDAKRMLFELSGRSHEVFTSVCFTGKKFQKIVNDRTQVWFKSLTEAEIDYYLDAYQPYDKAGSYGIQDWLGYIAIDKLEGCFFNVMGLPTRLVYKTLIEIADQGL
ncbi:MAG: Maf family nucleotide pyrophosphatase [Flavobacteriaceae bacterium]|nr:Maf family nucleotide pyrophosphatase [Flavobacteriaceae bacterium]